MECQGGIEARLNGVACGDRKAHAIGDKYVAAGGDAACGHGACQAGGAKVAVLDDAYTHLALRYEEIAARLESLENAQAPRKLDA